MLCHVEIIDKCDDYMAPINILIDFNYIGFSEYALFANYGKIKDPLKRERDQVAYIQSLTNRVFNLLYNIPKGGKIVFCIDSRSWRKDLMEQYKENREDNDGNKGSMDNETKKIFYSLLEEFGELLKGAGMIVSKVKGAEGDDLLFKWVKYFNDKGENCILISGDGDLTQVVQGPLEPWTVVWSKRTKNNKLFTVSDWYDNLVEERANTIFEFNVTDENGSLNKLFSDTETTINTINVGYYLLHKILIGDDGDDVPSSWKVYKGIHNGKDKYVRVTNKKAQDIIKAITSATFSCSDWMEVLFNMTDPNTSSFNSSSKRKPISEDELTRCKNKLNELSGVVLRVMGDVDDLNLRTKVSENLIRNTRLVWLKEEMLPYNLNQMINEHLEDSISKLKYDSTKWSKNGLLKGSRFGDIKSVPRNFDPFNFQVLPDEF